MQRARLPASFPITLLAAWSRSCERIRFITEAIVIGPVALACVHYFNFVVMLVVIIVGSWPVPYRAGWTPEGLEVRWLFVKEKLRPTDLESVRLRTNARYFFFMRYAQALELEFVDGRRAIIVAPQSLLGTLHAKFKSSLRGPPAAPAA